MTASDETHFDHDVVIVGSGFAGIGQAIALKRAGIRDFVVLEKASDLGGTWRDSGYPGCACDVPSHLYSFSFELNPDWSRAYSPAVEIWAYLRRCCTKYAVDPHVRFSSPLRAARYDEPSGTWKLTVGSMAGDYEMRCRSLVLGMGALNVPAYPDLPGLTEFTGDVVHTAAWDDSISLQGKHIGVIGTGASSIQVVPQLADLAAHLTVFQRTAPWVLPKQDPAFSAARRRRYSRWPLLARIRRARIFLENESRVVAFAHPGMMGVAERLARRHLHRQVGDPALRAALTPDYTIGCKRILVADDYYPTLTRDHVRLETTAIDHVDGRAVVTRDGARHELDVLVLGTGFVVNGSYQHADIRGIGGRELAQEWETAPEAHLGTMVAGYPNLFTLVGPNTGLGHTSMIIMIEAQNRLVVQALQERARRRAASIAVRREVQVRSNEILQERSRSAVWLTGCRSWYLDGSGVNRVIWPGSTLSFRRRTRWLQAADYRFGEHRSAPTSETASTRALR